MTNLLTDARTQPFIVKDTAKISDTQLLCKVSKKVLYLAPKFNCAKLGKNFNHSCSPDPTSFPNQVVGAMSP